MQPVTWMKQQELLLKHLRPTLEVMVAWLRHHCNMQNVKPVEVLIGKDILYGAIYDQSSHWMDSERAVQNGQATAGDEYFTTRLYLLTAELCAGHRLFFNKRQPRCLFQWDGHPKLPTSIPEEVYAHSHEWYPVGYYGKPDVEERYAHANPFGNTTILGEHLIHKQGPYAGKSLDYFEDKSYIRKPMRVMPVDDVPDLTFFDEELQSSWLGLIKRGLSFV